MKKFLKLREELNQQILSEEIYFGDMSDELLFDIISNESADEFHFNNALITLYERELVELSENDLTDLFEAVAALPSPQTKSVVPTTNNMPAAKSTAVSRPLPSQKALPGSSIKDVVGGKTLSSTPNLLPSASKSVGSAAKTTLGSVAKSAAGAIGRLASKYSPHATALTTGYEAGKQLNNISAVSKVTDKVGKWVADKISGKPEGNVVKAKSPEVSRKAPDTGPKTTVPAKSGGGMVSFPSSAKPANTPKSTPVTPKSVPKISSTPTKSVPAKPQTNNTMGMSSAAYNDLKSSAAKMKSATSDMAAKTGTMKSSLQKVAPSGRMERPITPGGQSSSSIHKSIAKLGGEPTRASAPVPKPVSKPAAVSGGAPTTAVGSKPPTLSSKNATGGKWM